MGGRSASSHEYKSCIRRCIYGRIKFTLSRPIQAAHAWCNSSISPCNMHIRYGCSGRSQQSWSQQSSEQRRQLKTPRTTRKRAPHRPTPHGTSYDVAKTPSSRGSPSADRHTIPPAPAITISGTPGARAAATRAAAPNLLPVPGPASQRRKLTGKPVQNPQDHTHTHPSYKSVRQPPSTSLTPPCAPAAHRSPEPLLL